MGPPPYELIISMVERDRVRLQVDDHDLPRRRGPLVRLATAFVALRPVLQPRGAPGRHLPGGSPTPQGNPPFAHGS